MGSNKYRQRATTINFRWIANWKSIFYCPITQVNCEKIHFTESLVWWLCGIILSYGLCWAQGLVYVGFGSVFQKFFKLAKERNCLASINDTNGDWGIQEAEGLKKATSSFIPALMPSLPWSLGPIDEVGGSMVVGVLISSPRSRRPSKRKNFLIIIQFTELQSSNFLVPLQHIRFLFFWIVWIYLNRLNRLNIFESIWMYLNRLNLFNFQATCNCKIQIRVCRAGLLHKFPTFNLPLFKFLFIVVFIQVSFAGFFIFGTPQKVTEKLLLLMKKSWVPFLKEIFGLSGNSCTVSDGSGWCKSDSKSFLLNASTKRSAAASEDEDPRLVKTSSSSMTSYFGPYSPPGAKIGQSYRKNNMF